MELLISKKRSRNSASKELELEADKSKIEKGIQMFQSALKKGLKIDYLLMDSWFTCNEFINAVRSIKRQTVHLIEMYCKTKLFVNDKTHIYSQLRSVLGKLKRNRKTGYQYIKAIFSLERKSVKLFFSRKEKNGKHFLQQIQILPL